MHEQVGLCRVRRFGEWSPCGSSAKACRERASQVLIEALHKAKADKAKAKALEEQSAAKKEKARLQKEKRAAKMADKVSKQDD